MLKILIALGLAGSNWPETEFFTDDEFAEWAEARIPGQRFGHAQAILIGSGYRLFYLERGGRTGQELLAPTCHGFCHAPCASCACRVDRLLQRAGRRPL